MDTCVSVCVCVCYVWATACTSVHVPVCLHYCITGDETGVVLMGMLLLRASVSKCTCLRASLHAHHLRGTMPRFTLCALCCVCPVCAGVAAVRELLSHWVP